jgi:hypothetical protein
MGRKLVTDKGKITPTAAVSLTPSLWGNEEENKIKVSNWEPFLKFDNELEKFKETEGVGYGIERCLYELTPELTCLSPYLIHAAVLTPVQALIALEEVAVQSDRPQSPIDRHLSAFLISRWKGVSYSDLRDLGKPQRELKNLATLRILSGIQVYFKINDLPNLCQWMAELCAPLVSQCQHLAARNRIKKDIAEAVATGQLTHLVKIFANWQGREKAEEEEFSAARAEVWLIESEIKEIEAKIQNRNEFIPNPQPNLWEKMSLFLSRVMHARAIRQGKLRISQLYGRWVILRDSWGDTLGQQSEDSSKTFWKSFRSKM